MVHIKKKNLKKKPTTTQHYGLGGKSLKSHLHSSFLTSHATQKHRAELLPAIMTPDVND